MQTSVKYKSEIKTVPFGNRTIRIENRTPILSPKERKRRERELETQLYSVFSKYARKWQ